MSLKEKLKNIESELNNSNTLTKENNDLRIKLSKIDLDLTNIINEAKNLKSEIDKKR